MLNGEPYFEAVDCISDLKKEIRYNKLALCPNHAAMFEHANGSAELMQEFMALTSNELDIVLAQKDATIYFTKTHLFDLKTIISVDKQE